MADDVVVRLTEDEALVLHAWLAAFNARSAKTLDDQAEQRVLWDLEASLEPQINSLFSTDYSERLQAARAAVHDPEE